MFMREWKVEVVGKLRVCMEEFTCVTPKKVRVLYGGWCV